MKDYECIGFWWLPEAPDAKVAGTLHISSIGELRLSLIGAFDRPENRAEDKSFPYVLGSVDESPRGNEVTLTGCYQIGISMGSYEGRRERYRAARGFFGAHLTQESDFAFRSCLLQVTGLAEWARPSSGAFSSTMAWSTPENRGKSHPIASYNMLDQPTGAIPGGTAALHLGLTSKSKAHTLSFREEAHITIDFDKPLNAEEINENYAYPLQNLLTFVSDRPQQLERFSVWRLGAGASWRVNAEIRIIGPRVQPEADERRAVRGDEMLFTAESVNFPSVLGAWLKLADQQSQAFNIFFGMQYGPPRYIDIQYSLALQVLLLYYSRTPEGISQRQSDESRLKGILKAVSPQDAVWIVEHLGIKPNPPLIDVLRVMHQKYASILNPLISSRREAFISQVSSTIQYIDNRFDEDYLAASHGADLYWLMQKVRYLIKACILSDLGLDMTLIESLFTRDTYYQHIIGIEKDIEARRSQHRTP